MSRSCRCDQSRQRWQAWTETLLGPAIALQAQSASISVIERERSTPRIKRFASHLQGRNRLYLLSHQHLEKCSRTIIIVQGRLRCWCCQYRVLLHRLYYSDALKRHAELVRSCKSCCDHSDTMSSARLCWRAALPESSCSSQGPCRSHNSLILCSSCSSSQTTS